MDMIRPTISRYETRGWGGNPSGLGKGENHLQYWKWDVFFLPELQHRSNKSVNSKKKKALTKLNQNVRF